MIVVEADELNEELIEKICTLNLINIMGPPGTGKSAKIIKIVDKLLKRREKVILTAETRWGARKEKWAQNQSEIKKVLVIWGTNKNN